MKILQILLFVLAPNYLLGQFSCSIPEKSIDCNIDFYKNNKYIIALSLFDNDGDINEYALSVGTYKYIKDTIILTDFYYEYTLKFLHNDKQLIPIKAYPWMLNQKFEKSSSYINSEYSQIAESPLKYYCPLIIKQKNEYHRLYYREYIQDEFSLLLMKNNYYVCKLGDLILSEGKFVYEKRYVKFRDKNLKYNFMGFVSEDGICVSFLPLNNACLKLKNVNDYINTNSK